MRYADLRAENERLRAALVDVFVCEMTFQNEPDDPSTYSEGWACAHCDLGDGCADRPYADEQSEVTHFAGCPLYRASPSEGEEQQGKAR